MDKNSNKNIFKLPSAEDLKWDELTAACSYFILHQIRDQRLPKKIFFHEEDFLYNAILNKFAKAKGYNIPPPTNNKFYLRINGAKNWAPNFFPDKYLDPFLILYKSLLIHKKYAQNLLFLEGISTECCKGVPPKKLFELDQNHIYFVRYGYHLFYLYYSLTNQEEDPPKFREKLMFDAILIQFPKSEEEIIFWMKIISDLSNFGVIKKPKELFAIHTEGKKFQPDKIPQFTQIPINIALIIINFLTQSIAIEDREEQSHEQVIICAECGNILTYFSEECPKCGSSYKRLI